MQKVTVFVGSAHKKNTFQAAAQFIENLQGLGDVRGEIVTLSDYRLGICRGCRVCFERGEEFCPLRDDRDLLLEKIAASDGVVLATPNYSFHVSGLMKVFLDHFGYIFHRPRYFGKAFTSLVTQGIGGGGKIVEYLDFVGGNLGFNTVKGITITALDPRTEKDQLKIDRALAAHSRRFYARLQKPAYPTPSLVQLMFFRMGRTTIRQMLDERSRDFCYYQEQGWLTADYYYPTRLGLLKQAAGSFFDATAGTVRSLLS